LAHRFYITTAIPYVNARPHLGFALEIIQTDAFARYHRLVGEDVRFLSGTDDNSLSNVQAAESEGIPTRALVDRNTGFFYALKDEFDISFDDFIKTSSEERHLAGATKLWQACDGAGDIYKKPYRGLYCVNCEQFYTEAEAPDGLCPDHRIALELVEEENYFFRLSAYAERLEQLIESDEYQVVPATRKNEILSFIRMGLEDFSISRSTARGRGWGVPVPGDPNQVMYVWFDALSNYINALGYATDDELYQRYWVNNPNRIHVVGKNIIRFHAVYWPAMLLSAGIPLPTTLFSHGFITLSGERMSKTRGNVIDPVDLRQEYGVDAVRHYLLRRIHPTQDSNFTMDEFVRSYNADLADQLGNLLSRVIGMVGRYYDGIVPKSGASHAADDRLRSKAACLFDAVDKAMRAWSPADALAAIWDLVGEANRYVVEIEPWKLAKARSQDPDAEDRLSSCLYALAEVLRLVSCACAPFMPSTATSIASQLGCDISDQTLDRALEWGQYPSGTKFESSGSLFPKLESPAGSGS
jgi:methionyl-tRNA synthetase